MGNMLEMEMRARPTTTIFRVCHWVQMVRANAGAIGAKMVQEYALLEQPMLSLVQKPMSGGTPNSSVPVPSRPSPSPANARATAPSASFRTETSVRVVPEGPLRALRRVTAFKCWGFTQVGFSQR